ncbi:MAG TPA: hypothetical protein VIY53_19075 [Acidobacteriaceae bacterium]
MHSRLLSAVCPAIASLFVLSAATSLFAQSRGDAFLPSPARSASTISPNGDVNPYGVAFVRDNFQTGAGPLQHGDILVSNFNNAENLQGTGSTIMRIPASGAPSVFFRCTSMSTTPLGLSTGLGTLQYGFVLVTNLPTLDGTSNTAQPGSLLVINNQGKLIQAFSGSGINGPWDATYVDEGDRAIAFIANAIDGTITRLDFAVSPSGLTELSHATIASDYRHQGDPAALFDAPTGLVYDHQRDSLYVASTLDNAVFVVHDAARRSQSAGPGDIVYQDNTHLHGALAMAEAPNGHLLVTNNDVINPDVNQPSEIVEFTKAGEFVKEISVDPNLGGSFGLAVHRVGDHSAILAAVDDNTAYLTMWTVPLDN